MISFLASVLLNLLFVGTMLLVTMNESPPPPPAIIVTSALETPERPLETPKLDRPVAAPRTGGAPPLSVLPVVASAASDMTMSIPDLPSFDAGLAGLAGIGPGFGPGIGMGGGASGDGGSMKVGTMVVKSQRLGVILDVSGSMEEELPAVRQELRRAFAQAKTVKVEGCGLDWNGPTESREGRIRLRSSADSVLEAVEMLVVDGRVDAIYWFSDLQDSQTEPGLERLGDLLDLEKGRGKAVRLYVRSLERKPSSQLATIVRASGGAVQAGKTED